MSDAVAMHSDDWWVRTKLVLLSLVLAATYLVALVVFFEPMWETNDDVAMAMAAHGYGFANMGSPNLLFSNVLWGMIVRALDGLFGIQGYSLGTLGVLLLAAWSQLYFFERLRTGRWLSVTTVIAVMTWPILFPQFTMNAGLVSCAAVLGIYLYGEARAPTVLVASGILAILGFLIRSLEFVLVFAAAAPLLPWKLLLRDRAFQVFWCGLLLAFTGAFVADAAAYQSPAWRTFSEFNLARAPYTDFGLGERVKERPDILAAHNYSLNDIDLISNWFFEDPRLAKANSLNSMAAALGPNIGPLSASRLDVEAGLEGLSQLSSPRFVPLLYIAAVLIVLSFRMTLLATGGLALAAVFGLGLVGANVHGRVLFPLVVLVVVMGVASFASEKRRFQRLALSSMMLGAAAYTLAVVPPLSVGSAARVEAAQTVVAVQGGDVLFVWGGGLDYEAAYPVKSTIQSRQFSPPLYALGVMTYAPFSAALGQRAVNQGMVDRLQRPEGISIIAAKSSLALLRTYCEEHLRAELTILTTANSEMTGVQRINCAVLEGQ